MTPKRPHESGQLRTVIVAWVGDVVAAVVGPHGPHGPSAPNGLLGHLLRRRPDDRFPPAGELVAYPIRPAVTVLRVRATCGRRPDSSQSPSGRRRWDGAPSRCRRAHVDLRDVPLRPPR